MYKEVHMDKGRFLVNQIEYLRKHDIVYKTPAYKGYEGLPIGNGDMGFIVWNSPDQIEIAINKSDILEKRDDGPFRAWGWEEEEKNTAIVSAGKLILGDSMPSFDWLYLKNFEQRLNLGEAEITLNSETPFSTWKYNIYASSKNNVFVAEFETNAQEPIERTIRLERWGSRNFFHYYEQFVQDPVLKLEGTSSGVYEDCIFIQQQLKGMVFVVTAKLITDNYITKTTNRHCTEFITEKKENNSFILLLTVVTESESSNLLRTAVDRLNSAAINLESVKLQHRKDWQDFWEKSFVSISDDYIENIYYFNLYQFNSSCRGKYPPLFTGGLWLWNHDIRNWGHFYHWNEQQMFWWVYSSNHGELAENYLNYRFNMLENARKDAREIFDAPGAFFSDISSFTGYQAFEPDTKSNLTVGPQIALDFYRHYLFTGDIEFLKTKAYPFMKECAAFYMNFLSREDEKYHINSATSYESYWVLQDTITDWSMIHALFNTLIEVSRILNISNESITVYQEVLENLYLMPVTKMNHNGKTINIASVGIKLDGNPVGITEGEYPFSPFPGSVLAPVFPAGIVGLSQYNSDLFNTMKATAEIVFKNDVFKSEKMNCSGHAPYPQIAARLGMSKQLKKILERYIERYQCFPNGFMHYMDILDEYYKEDEYYSARVLTGKEMHTKWEELHEKTKGKRVLYPVKNFYHMYYESASNVICGINEMLLQSHDGIIRVFPAVPERESACFMLAACGGFIIISEKYKTDIRYILIKSKFGNKCKLYIPWTETISLLHNDEEINDYILNNRIIEFQTLPGEDYIIQKAEFPVKMYYKTKIETYINNNIKRRGKVKIGKEKNF